MVVMVMIESSTPVGFKRFFALICDDTIICQIPSGNLRAKSIVVCPSAADEVRPSVSERASTYIYTSRTDRCGCVYHRCRLAALLLRPPS